MKRLALLLLSVSSSAICADVSGVHNVYLLKMGHGLDQYLANRLTNEHVFQIVTDPKLADAILTDQIGPSFEAKMDELFPPPEPEQPPAPEKPAKPEKPATSGDEPNMVALMSETSNKLTSPASSSSFGRAKGMVFIVDAKSKQVVWSAYSLPKDGTSKELDRTASDIVSRLKRELGKK